MSVVKWGSPQNNAQNQYRTVSENGGDEGSDSGQRSAFGDRFHLVRKRTTFENTSQIEKHLPDILGRALARSWIDPEFRTAFATSPLDLLARYEVFLPTNITIEYETKETLRPRIVVYEKAKFGMPRKRLLYLQLIMMAGK